MIDSSPLPALANVHFEVADHHQLDEVVTIMEASFDDRFGEGWTRSQCAGILPMRGVSMLIARNDAGQAVGFSLQRIVIGDGELLLLAVDPKFRRRGIGQGLLQKFIEHARSEGASHVHLEVRDGNPAVEMYREAGFAPVGKRSNYYHGANGKRFDALTLSKEL